MTGRVNEPETVQPLAEPKTPKCENLNWGLTRPMGRDIHSTESSTRGEIEALKSSRD